MSNNTNAKTVALKANETEILIPATIELAEKFVEKATPQALIQVRKFNEKQLAEAAKRAAEVNFDDSLSLMTFGAEAQRNMTSYLLPLTDNIKAKDAGIGGDYVISLTKGMNMLKIKDYHEKTSKMDQKFFDVFAIVNIVKVFYKRQKKVRKLMDKVLSQMAEDRIAVTKAYAMFEALVRQTLEFQDEMALSIIAGEAAQIRMTAEKDRLVKLAEESGDVQELSEADDFIRRLETFETRVIDMKIAYFDAMGSIQNLRTAQNAERLVLEDLQRTELNDIPALLQAIVTVASMIKTAEVLKRNAKTQDARHALQTAAVHGAGRANLDALDTQGKNLVKRVNQAMERANLIMDYAEQAAEKRKENKDLRAEAAASVADAAAKLSERMIKLNKDLAA